MMRGKLGSRSSSSRVVRLRAAISFSTAVEKGRERGRFNSSERRAGFADLTIIVGGKEGAV